MAKLLENTSRHINIAAVNQRARLCHRLNPPRTKLPTVRSGGNHGFPPQTAESGGWLALALGH
jgi:hypothetical protein